MRDMEFTRQSQDGYKKEHQASTLMARDYKGATDLIISIGNGQMNNISMQPIANTLDTLQDPQKILKKGAGVEKLSNSVVRRLTPKECERLQGMPDNWSKYGVNEKGEVYELSDSARYKLQGNGIATPWWRWLLKRISAQYEKTPTLGSLFDGQASFPMIWEGINGPGTAAWSSEIERDAIAVAKYHFPDVGGETNVDSK